MKAIHMVQLRWLSSVMDHLEGTDYDDVWELLGKQYKDLSSLTEEDLTKIDRIFKKVRYQIPQESMVS